MWVYFGRKELPIAVAFAGFALLLAIIFALDAPFLNFPPNLTFTNDTTPDFSFNVSGNSSSYNCTLYLNSAAYGTNESVQDNTETIITANSSLTDGNYNWYINCTNGTDSNTSETRQIMIDLISPQVSISSPASNSSLTNRTIIINLTVTEINLNYTNISITNSTGLVVNSTTNTSNGTVIVAISVPVDGTYNITATTYDLAENSNSTTNSNITIDATPPTTTALAVSSSGSNYTFGEAANTDYINVTLICSDGLGSGCSITLYCTDTNNSCMPNLTYSAVVQVSSEGTNYIRFLSNDSLGNLELENSRTVIIDSSVPVVSFVPPTETNDTTLNRNWARINVSIKSSNLGLFGIYWNGTNHSIYDSSLLLAFNFENNSVIGENSTKAADISRYRNNGTIYGATWSQYGKFGGAYQFDGNDDYISVPNVTSLDITGSFSISGWFNLTNETFINVTSGNTFSCGLLANGSAICWGYNNYGQLGDNTTINRALPVYVKGGYVFKGISAGEYHACGVLTNGSAMCWGLNGNGQLGISNTTTRYIPTLVNSTGNFSSISAGSYQTCARLINGSLMCWGRNDYGQLGISNITQMTRPVLVNSTDNFTQVSSGYYHTCALLVNNSAMCWGRNNYGQLGNGSAVNYATKPQLVLGGYNYSSIASTMGGNHACAILTNGSAMCWGLNGYGQLGSGNATNLYLPNLVLGGDNFSTLSAYNDQSCGILTNGSMKTWGNSLYGQGGRNVASEGYSGTPGLVLGSHNFSIPAPGYLHTCALAKNGSIMCWGYNSFGEIGDGTTCNKLIPNIVAAPDRNYNFSSVHASYRHTCGIMANGTAMCWGYNYDGQVADGTSGDKDYNLDQLDYPNMRKDSPVYSAAGYQLVSISFGRYHACGLQTSGTAFCWGYDNIGELGAGYPSGGHYEEPVPVYGDYNFTSIGVGYRHTCGLLINGSMMCWGYNNYGQLGDNTTTSENIPNPVYGDYIYSGIASSVDSYHTCALLANNTPVCWGYNSNGQLGNGNVTQMNLPVLVNSTYNFTNLSIGMYHSCGILTNGSAMCWGYNSNGQLGNGNVTQMNNPTRVNSTDNFTKIVAGSYHTCGLLTNGTLKCWGKNTEGQIGNGSITQANNPTLVYGNYNFTDVALGESHTCGLTSSNVLLCWGYGRYGQLGLGNITWRHVPTKLARGVLVGKSAESYALIYNYDGSITGSVNGYNSPYYLPSGWHNVILSYDKNSSMDLFVDNSLAISRTLGHAVRYDTSSVSIGSSISGLIDEVKIYNRSLTPDEVSLNYWGDFRSVNLTHKTYYTNLTNISSGNYTYYAWAENNAEVPSQTQDYALNVEVTPPATTTSAVKSNGSQYTFGSSTSSPYVNVTLSCDDWIGVGCNETLYCTDTSNNCTPSLTYSSPVQVSAEDITYIRYYSDDNYGNVENISSSKIWIDTVAPTANFTYPTPENDTWINRTWLELNISVQDKNLHNLTLNWNATNYSIYDDSLVLAMNFNNNSAIGENSTYLADISVYENNGTISGAAFNSSGRFNGAIDFDGNDAIAISDSETLNLTDNFTISIWVKIETMNVTKIGSGAYFSCTLLSDGKAMCWGSNGYGQLGDGTFEAKYTAVPVSGDYRFTEIDGGWSHACGLLANGSAMCWGNNDYYQLGNGSAGGNSAVPGFLYGGYNFTNISVGYFHTCGLLTNGSAMCWGTNTYGQLGDNTTSNSAVPVEVVGGYNFTSVSAGGYDSHSCGLLTNGSAMCWGRNEYGQLGIGSVVGYMAEPTLVTGGYDFASVHAGQSFTCGLLSNGSAMCWGRNQYGALGDGGINESYDPVPVYGGYNFTRLYSASEGVHSCGLLTDGSAMCWGGNWYGQLGNGTLVDSNIPVSTSGGTNFTDLSLGQSHACGILANGSLICWGDNGGGELGRGFSCDKQVPVDVAGNYRFVEIHSSMENTCGVLLNGTALCWGYNNFGQLGDNTTTSAHSPVPVYGGYNFISVEPGEYHTCGLLANGSAMCWGNNDYYQLGNGSAGGSSLVPIMVEGGNIFTNLTSGESYTCGLLANGSAMCWGGNWYGELGIGNFSEMYTPTLVNSGAVFIQISAGDYHTCGLLANGSAMCWGLNTKGNLGDGTTVTRPNPTLVSSIATFIQLSAGGASSCGLLTNGSAMCWGSNWAGQLGTQTPEDFPNKLPVPVSGGHIFKGIYAGAYHTCGVLENGSAMCWGGNDWGQLGTIAAKNDSNYAPLPVFGDYNFTSMALGYYHSCGLLTNGTAMCWGYDEEGYLGDGFDFEASGVLRGVIIGKSTDSYAITATFDNEIQAFASSKKVSKKSVNNGWHLITYTYEKGKSSKLYVDGQLVDAKSQQYQVFAQSAELYIGQSLTGSVDEVRIWNRSLQDDEIQVVSSSELAQINSTSYGFYTNISGLEDKNYTTYAYVDDFAETSAYTDNATEGSPRYLLVHATGPSITVTTPQAHFNNASVTISTTITDSKGVDSCWYSLNNWATNTTFDCSTIEINGSEGQNTLRIGANDTLENINTSVPFIFWVDFTAPEIFFSCSPESVEKGDPITCSCSATDDFTPTQNITLSYSQHPLTDTVGEIVTTCTATDLAGNFDGLNIVFLVTAPSKGGGGGGGGALPGTSKATYKDDDFSLEIYLNREIVRPSINVTYLNIPIPEKSGERYSSFEITPYNFGLNDASNFTVDFRVSLFWLQYNNIESVYLEVYNGSEWVDFRAERSGLRGNYANYRAYTTPFLKALIIGRSSKCTEAEKKCDGNSLLECRKDSWKIIENCTYGCDIIKLSCNLPPPVLGPCRDGDKICIGNELKICVNSTWVLLEKCPLQCSNVTYTCSVDRVTTLAPFSREQNYIFLIVIAAGVLVIAIYLEKRRKASRKPHDFFVTGIDDFKKY